jgi:hypothetical protein
MAVNRILAQKANNLVKRTHLLCPGRQLFWETKCRSKRGCCLVLVSMHSLHQFLHGIMSICIWSCPVTQKLNGGISPLILCRIHICCSIGFVIICTCCPIIAVCLWYLRCLFNWPQAIGVFIFVSWNVKLIGEIKWNPIRSDNFRGFQWNVVDEQTKSKHVEELIKLPGERYKY